MVLSLTVLVDNVLERINLGIGLVLELRIFLIDRSSDFKYDNDLGYFEVNYEDAISII